MTNDAVLVTGVGRRLGHHVATQLLERGVEVVGTFAKNAKRSIPYERWEPVSIRWTSATTLASGCSSMRYPSTIGRCAQ